MTTLSRYSRETIIKLGVTRNGCGGDDGGGGVYVHPILNSAEKGNRP